MTASLKASPTTAGAAEVVILGAGPAGLVLGNLLLTAGVDCLVLERGEREHVLARARAGYLAEHAVRVLERHGLAEGVRRDGREHGVCEFRTQHNRFRIDYGKLGAKVAHTVYPQHRLVADLLARYTEAGGRILFGTEAVAVHDPLGPRPEVEARDRDGVLRRRPARHVAGCDGRHGAARRSMPAETVRHRRDHGVTWLGLIAEAPQSLDAVGYAVHPRGFAGHMARSARVTRYYLQVAPGTDPDAWSEDEIWAELSLRLGATEHGALRRGPITERTLVDLRSDVLEPLRHGSLFLAGDAAGLISPSGAKGANLAVVAAEILAEALVADLRHGDPTGLADYSRRCLEHIWRAQEFSHWMIELLHADPDPTLAADERGFRERTRQARLDSLRTSLAHRHWFAENYVGL
ncbi:4-hydroxybenzoate 3-monooxygenase (plasmid) [Streptomyces sp. BI20]|uniref:4-hydroxybenzoate 3-monooxygenase n=1 Tax=Streptomyces sp. BI20 TaxID=3403460 RepID=UPI003C7386C0